MSERMHARVSEHTLQDMRTAASQRRLPEHGNARGVKQPLSREQVGSMRPAKVFSEALHDQTTGPSSGKKHITSLTFDETGEFATTTGEDDYIHTWNCRTGQLHKNTPSLKYGADNVTATHKTGTILHSSTKRDHGIRQFSAHDKKYLRYFMGHEGRVLGMSMNPVNDVFLSGGEDATVLMWDLRTDKAKGKLREMGGSTLVAWDSTGSCFAVGIVEESAIALYSAASFDKEPFVWSHIVDPELAKISSPPRRIVMTSLNFSNDGKYILVGTSSDTHYLLEAFSLQVVVRLVGARGLERDKEGKREVTPRRGMSGHEVAFTPDSKFVFSGSHNGEILIWDLKPPPESGLNEWIPPTQPEPITKAPRKAAPALNPFMMLNKGNEKAGPSRVVGFNPRLCMFVSGGHELVMWLPQRAVEEDEDDDAAGGS